MRRRVTVYPSAALNYFRVTLQKSYASWDQLLQRGRYLPAAHPRRHPHRHLQRPRHLLQGSHGHADRQLLKGRRRPHHRSRPRRLRGQRPRPHHGQLPRLRHPHRSATVIRRHPAGGDPQHSPTLPSRQHWPRPIRRSGTYHHRGLPPRLQRSRRLPRRLRLQYPSAQRDG
jgi:hypothetical protein